MADVVKGLNTEDLIEYLGRKDLKLDEDDIKILRKEKLLALTFLIQLKKSFEVMEMLRRNKVNEEDITSIKQFTPETMSDANEATRCEFISSVLHSSIVIAISLKRLSLKKFCSTSEGCFERGINRPD
ncbi:hypothetical protein C1646_672708 [Rhizophagus diaphanus]|nr:hypothetical protein C1646_672708 [Rhizophagus diaphanus] [Rhizophagus sp. MUCL 43196]